MKFDWFKVRRREREIQIGRWYTGFPFSNFKIEVNERDYDSDNWTLNICMFGWFNKFTLPFKNNSHGWERELRYGIGRNDDYLYVAIGKKSCTWDIPFYCLQIFRHDVECHTEDESCGSLTVSYGTEMVPSKVLQKEVGDRKFYADSDRINFHKKKFFDNYDNEEITATYWYEEREWRRKWMKWTKLFSYSKQYIEVSFDKEVGARKDEWKGGTVGCSCDLENGETIEQCFDRMITEEGYGHY